MPELYDLARDPREQTNVWDVHVRETKALYEDEIAFLEQQGTPDDLLAPSRDALGSSCQTGERLETGRVQGAESLSIQIFVVG